MNCIGGRLAGSGAGGAACTTSINGGFCEIIRISAGTVRKWRRRANSSELASWRELFGEDGVQVFRRFGPVYRSYADRSRGWYNQEENVCIIELERAGERFKSYSWHT